MASVGRFRFPSVVLKSSRGASWDTKYLLRLSAEASLLEIIANKYIYFKQFPAGVVSVYIHIYVIYQPQPAGVMVSKEHLLSPAVVFY